MASCFPPSEFDGRLLAYNPSEGHWQNYPSETQQQNYKLLIAQNHSNEGIINGLFRFKNRLNFSHRAVILQL